MARPTEARDSEAVRRLIATLDPDHHEQFKEDVRQGWKSFVAERDGLVVGYLLGTFVDYGRPHESSGMIEQLVVDEQYRESGVGRELVQTFWEWLGSEGISLAFVSTMDGSEAAAFYERCGFVRCRGPWLVRSEV